MILFKKIDVNSIMYTINDFQHIQNFFFKIRFNKDYYDFYNQVLCGRKYLNDYILILFICQTAFKIGFIGHFNELFNDIYKRKEIYYKQILLNFKTAYLYKENICSKIYYKFKGLRSPREIVFHRFYSVLHINDFIWTMFENDNYKDKFIIICNEIMLQKSRNTKIDKVVPINYDINCRSIINVEED